MTTTTAPHDVCVFGGAGHIGLPLAILCAVRGMRTVIYDIDASAIARIRAGEMPFADDGGPPLLTQALATGMLRFASSVEELRGVPAIIVTIGTPVDEFLNPDTRQLRACLDALLPILDSVQTLILRSTIAPGTTVWVDDELRRRGRAVRVAFCPERVVQGRAIVEMQSLPQIVSGCSPEAVGDAEALFGKIAPSVVRMEPMEAELGKLFCNAYRYAQFAIANQFYMLTARAGLDYTKILAGLQQDYPRIRDLPGPGLAAGPCLFKDTMQLVASSKNLFSIGMNAMMANEGLPDFLVDEIEERWGVRRRSGPPERLVVGLLGMAFKSNSDDPRSSLSYKLKKLLIARGHDVLTTDPFVKTDAELRPLDDVVRASTLLILCAPHRVYRDADLGGKPIVDVWNFFGRGALVPDRAGRTGRAGSTEHTERTERTERGA